VSGFVNMSQVALVTGRVNYICTEELKRG